MWIYVMQSPILHHGVCLPQHILSDTHADELILQHISVWAYESRSVQIQSTGVCARNRHILEFKHYLDIVASLVFQYPAVASPCIWELAAGRELWLLSHRSQVLLMPTIAGQYRPQEEKYCIHVSLGSHVSYMLSQALNKAGGMAQNKSCAKPMLYVFL